MAADAEGNAIDPKLDGDRASTDVARASAAQDDRDAASALRERTNWVAGQAALQENEERQAFLLKLSDALRALRDPAAIQQLAIELTAEHLDVGRVTYADIVHEPEVTVVVGRDWPRRGMPSVAAGRFKIDDFGPFMKHELMAARPAIVVDATTDSRLTATERAAWQTLQIVSSIGVPVMKDERLVALFGAQDNRPHQWSDAERRLLSEIGDRVWEAMARARAEAALRESEEKYRSLFERMGQAYALAEVVRNASGQVVDYRLIDVNPAFTRITDIAVETARGRTVLELMPSLEPWWIETAARIVDSGRPERIEHEAAPLGRWYQAFLYPAGGDRFIALHEDITERKRAEIALRESEERQAFLLKLSDALRPKSDPVDIQETAVRLLAEHLDVMRATYFEVDDDGDGFTLTARYERNAAPVPKRMRLSDFGQEIAAANRAGQTVVFRDTETDTHLGSQPEMYRHLGLRAWIAVPLVKAGRLIAVVGANSATARNWTDAQVRIVEDVADRTWAAVERARAEAARRASEERYRSLFTSIDEGFVVFELVYDTNDLPVDALYLETNPALERHAGVRDLVGKHASDIVPNLEPSYWESFDRICRTGQPERTEMYNGDTKRWYAKYDARVGGPGSRVLCEVVSDITERKAAEAALRESEERQAFLLKLSDALRTEIGPTAVAERALRSLFDRLGIDSCCLAVFKVAENRADFIGQVRNDLVPALPDSARISDFPEAFEAVRERTLALDDIETAEFLSDLDKQSFRGLGYRAFICATVRRGEGNPDWVMVAVSANPRRWTPSEIALVEDTAERTWAAMERARAEDALRESEEKYRTLFETMGQGYSLNEIVRDAEGRAIDLRYVELNPAFERLTGASLKEARGRLASEVFPGLDRFWIDICDRAVMTGVIERVEHELTPNGRWYQSNFYPVGGDLCLSLYDDITERKRAEAALRESRAHLAREVEDAQILQTISTHLVWEPGVHGHFRHIVEAARALMRSDAASIQELDPDSSKLKLVEHVGFHPESAAFWDWVDAGVGSSCGHALARRERIVVPDMDRFEADPHDVEAYRKSGINSVQSTPLIARSGQIVGMMSTHWADRQTPREENYRFFDILARLAADFIERTRAEAALRESEERQAYLLELNDALRPLTDPTEIQHEAMRLLGERIGVSRAQYYTADETGEYLSSSGGYTDGVPAAIGRFRLIEFGKYAYDGFHAGETQVVSDARTDPRISETVLKSYETVGFLAYIGVPFVQRGRFLGTIAVHQTGPREWTESERMMVEETAARAGMAVEQAVAETALRESEERLRTLNERLEERVRERTSEVRSLFERLVSAQEEERRRIARDIHDQVGQQMTALRMNLETLQSQAAGQRALVEQAERTQQLAEELDRSIDFLTWQLRPAALDHLGLSAALENLVTGWSERFAVTADFAVDGVQEVRLPRDVEANLYRITQEALHNIAKHARATQVTVHLMERHEHLVLIIEDNGRGFDPDRRPPPDSDGGMGLLNMRERAALMGGRLDVESIAGHGTTIYVRIHQGSRTHDPQ